MVLTPAVVSQLNYSATFPPQLGHPNVLRLRRAMVPKIRLPSSDLPSSGMNSNALRAATKSYSAKRSAQRSSNALRTLRTRGALLLLCLVAWSPLGARGVNTNLATVIKLSDPATTTEIEYNFGANGDTNNPAQNLIGKFCPLHASLEARLAGGERRRRARGGGEGGG